MSTCLGSCYKRLHKPSFRPGSNRVQSTRVGLILVITGSLIWTRTVPANRHETKSKNFSTATSQLVKLCQNTSLNHGCVADLAALCRTRTNGRSHVEFRQNRHVHTDVQMGVDGPCRQTAAVVVFQDVVRADKPFHVTRMRLGSQHPC